MNSDDEAYNKFIVTSDEEEKENVSDKQPKTSREQFDLMSKFTEGTADLNEQSITKQEYDWRWKSLAEELNQIGPPLRNSIEWRRVWSVFKYNQKRKQPVVEAIGKRRSCQEQPVIVHPHVASDGQPSISVQILDKLNEIVNVLKVIAENTSR